MTLARPRLIGLSATALAVLVLALLFRPPALPWASDLHLSLEAASFGELNKDAAVELGGVRVGRVEGMSLRAGRPVIGIAVDRRYAGLLHADASAAIRPHGLLGPRFVELEGGARGRMADGATIPVSRVHVATDVDQVLNALQPDVRRSLQVLIVELGGASEGRGQDVNATLLALGRATDDLARVTATLHGRDQDLAGTVVSAEELNRELQGAPLDAQIRDTNRVLAGLVQVDGSIGAGIDHTALLLQQLDVVMDGNSENLGRTLDRAPATVARLRAVLAAGTDLLNGVNPALPSLMTAVVETESTFSGSDANGHYARILTLTGGCTLGLSTGCGTPASSTSNPTSIATAPAAMQPASALPQSPRSHTSDQELLRLFLGNI